LEDRRTPREGDRVVRRKKMRTAGGSGLFLYVIMCEYVESNSVFGVHCSRCSGKPSMR